MKTMIHSMDLSTIRISPGLIPASIMEVPSTLTKKVAVGFFWYLWI
jgi:hypothetical protein